MKYYVANTTFSTYYFLYILNLVFLFAFDGEKFGWRQFIKKH